VCMEQRLRNPELKRFQDGLSPEDLFGDRPLCIREKN
jgi:hypothetical protein